MAIKIFKIKMMSGIEIPLESREALDKLIEAANKGAKLVVTKYGVINTASIDSITPHKELMAAVAEELRYGRPEEEIRKTLLGFSAFDDEGKKLNAGK